MGKWYFFDHLLFENFVKSKKKENNTMVTKLTLGKGEKAKFKSQ